MDDIFISYAQEDGEQIKPLVALLESQGWSVFWDRELLPGDNWTTLIDQKLKGAKAAIVVWSRHSTASEWVKAEAMAARERAILAGGMAFRPQQH
ncbi:MAG: toll/interleukin-1 receptor domain-containing protein [Hyphomicrobium sp.]|uniref:toll/interleukin-1 receptor domain-containing protein n=1 Tax=Hyphomicrobium sp. TaxID=82 RepID=UPI003D1121EC